MTCDRLKIESKSTGVPIVRHKSEDRYFIKPVSIVKYCYKNCPKFTDKVGGCTQQLIEALLEARKI